MGNVAGEISAVLAMIEKTFGGEEAAFGEGGVNGGAGVSLREKETIARRRFRILRIEFENRPVEDGDDVSHREGGADMGGPAAVGHAQHVQADAAGQGAEFGDVRVAHRGNYRQLPTAIQERQLIS